MKRAMPMRPRTWWPGLLAAALLAALAVPVPARAAECPPASTYTVVRGDALYAIARRFGTTTEALARLNRLPNPDRIYAGQVLALPGGGQCAASPAAASVHIVQRGETLSRIAARYGTTVQALAAANQIANPSRIFVGQRLVIPAGPAASANAPAALAGLRLWPASPEQGRTWSVSVPVGEYAAAAGSLGAWPLHFFREGEALVGLVGIYALANPGPYTLKLELTTHSGSSLTHTQSVAVVSGGYGHENLVLSPDKSQLLDPRLTIPERERVAAAVAPVTPARWWQGLFQLPAAGRVTSAFGTRRSYNGGPYNSYHGGVDFSFSGGPDIRAPGAGVVVLAEALTVRGNATILDHGWGVYSGFWHQAEILVRAGEVVQAGQLIGRIGDTGLVTGPHLHWEMFVGGVQVDALQWTRQPFP